MKKHSSKKHASKPSDYGKLILVTWRDTSGSAAWHSLHESLPEPPIIRQAGFFIASNKDTLYMCQGLPTDGVELAPDCQILAPTAIPLGCIVSIKEIKE